jgi:arginyl-tRNA synthetase
MNFLSELRRRFRDALAELVDDPAELLSTVKPSQDAQFGDYQANCAMPLGKRLGRAPREVAQQIVELLNVADLCETPEIAGPGFINLRLKRAALEAATAAALTDERLGVATASSPRTYVIDYSAPNVAKPMHVGHIRSTVIGDALARTLRFLGHRVVTDNHIGDWGTQFGMILYGFKHFLDAAAYRENAVAELGRLYRTANTLVEYQEARQALPALEAEVRQQEEALARQPAAPAGDKNAAKAQRRAADSLREAQSRVAALRTKVSAVEQDPQLSTLANEHPNIARGVLHETLRLHQGDPENLGLWREFLPPCLADIERIYRRLDVRFDHTLGESFYHDRLAGVVADLAARGLARESDGAMAVFLPNQPAPMLIQKQDGAFLYATSDLATIQYRVGQWRPDAILYVVDHRQSLHFEQLFATARLWGYENVELTHVGFGTVLGDDGRPFKTRSGQTVGLEGLLDEAVERALAIVSANDDAEPGGRRLSPERRREVAEAIGIGALKYADLSQNRTSDYVFSYDKMLAMNGNTATYMQYAYARSSSIFAKGGIDPAELRARSPEIHLEHEAERALSLALARFSEAIDLALEDYRPNALTSYLFDLANRYSTLFEQCPVLKAETEVARQTRLVLCDLTARTIQQGLSLLGIRVVERM